MTSQKSLITKLTLFLLIASPALTWSKCKAGECKYCDIEGCQKCYNKILNLNHFCVTPNITNNATWCLRPGTGAKKCQVCQPGYVTNQDNECTLVTTSNCAAGTWHQGAVKCITCMGTAASFEGSCNLTIPASYQFCTATNTSYGTNEKVTQCSQCDYGYALDSNNVCVPQCTEGCLKCENQICVECDFYRSFWMTSPHNCTNTEYQYWGQTRANILAMAGVGILLLGSVLI